jgi:hypothetical protein
MYFKQVTLKERRIAMKKRRSKLTIAMVALALAVLLVAQAECQEGPGYLTGYILGGFYKDGKLNIENAVLEVCDPINGTKLFSLYLVLTDEGYFTVECNPGEYRLRIIANDNKYGLSYYGFYNGEYSDYNKCFADSKTVSVIAGQSTDISSELEFRPPVLVLTHPVQITGIITGTNGDPLDPQVVAMDACSGDVLGTASINKIIIKNDEEPNEEPVEKTTFSFDKNCVGPVRLRFLIPITLQSFAGRTGRIISAEPRPFLELLTLGRWSLEPRSRT